MPGLLHHSHGRRKPVTGRTNEEHPVNDSAQAPQAPAGDAGQPIPSPEEALRLAIQLHQHGRVEEAERIYRMILSVFPGQPETLHFLGVLLHQRGESEHGIACIRQAIERQGTYPAALNNLGNILTQLRRFEAAAAAYRRAIAQDPNFADPHLNLGNLLMNAGRHADAAAAYARALELNPRHRDSYEKLGAALIELKRYDEAAAVFEKWLHFEPDNPVARHLLAACAGGPAPLRASDAYVRETFDRFSASFDEVLGAIHYHAPQLLAEAVRETWSGVPWEILDAGCGTGLCGPLIKPVARRLVGVDLSPGMLDKARQRGVYDELIEAELTEYLRRISQMFDLIISADTFIYFGELLPVFQGAAAALREGGFCVFSVEQAREDSAEAGYRLQPHGRYCHTETYVRQRLRQAGLKPLRVLAATVREENAEAVPGLVVTAGKASG